MPPKRHEAPDVHPPALFYADQETIFAVGIHEPRQVPTVPERLVQDLWQHLRFDTAGLTTTEGAPVVVFDPGRPNTDAGPDFVGARLRIGETDWRGSVEVHTTSSGWFAHRHHTDPRYNSVVLHVTLHADVWTGGLTRADGTAIPEIVLFPRLTNRLRDLLYAFHTQRQDALPCGSRWSTVPESVRKPWLEALGRERLETKTRLLDAAWRREDGLEQLLYERLLAGLGYAKNTEPMATLARRIPLGLARTLTEPLDLEALYFGVAGLLPAPADLLQSDRATADYVMELRDRFTRLQLRLDLSPMERSSWQFFRLRPANFPPLRIAQAAALLAPPDGLLHRNTLERLRAAAMDEYPVHALRTILVARPGPFWEYHLRLDRRTQRRDPSIGKGRIDALIVNAVLPVLLLSAARTQDAVLEERLLHILRTLPAETDEVTRRFATLGTRPSSAFETQALHQLYRSRCSEARCLTCAIGAFLLEDA